MRYRPDSPLSPAWSEDLQSLSTSLKLAFCPATASWNSGYFQGFFVCFKILWTLPKKQLVRYILSTCWLMLWNILDLETQGSTSLVQGKPAVDSWFVWAGTFCHHLVKKKKKCILTLEGSQSLLIWRAKYLLLTLFSPYFSSKPFRKETRVIQASALDIAPHEVSHWKSLELLE